MDVSLDYGLTLLAALLIGTGFVLQQNTAQREPASRFLSLRLMTDLLRAPRWLTGIACMVGGQVLAAWSFGHLSLAFVEPLLTTNLVFALLLAVPLAKASLKLWEVLGAAVLCTGVALLSSSRSAKPIGLSFGSVSHWPAAAVIAGIAFIAVHAGLRRPGRRRAMLTGAGAGLVFGIQDALTRQTLEILQSSGVAALFTNWAPYALVGAGATGIWLMQSAFSAGPLQVSLPAISAGEPLVGILLGVIVFGDRIQVTPGLLALQAGGIAALVAGVIMVGRGPALSQLRSWTPPGIPHAIPGRHQARADDGPVIGQALNGQSPNGQAPNGQAGGDHPAGGETTQKSQPDMRGLRRPSRSPRPPAAAARRHEPRRHVDWPHDPFHAGERLRPDEQLRGDRRCAPRPRAPGGVRRRGVLARQAGRARLRGGPRRPRPARDGGRGRPGPGPVLEGFHPRHSPGVPQAHDRPARNGDQADLGRPDRWRQVLREPAQADHRQDAAGHHRHR